MVGSGEVVTSARSGIAHDRNKYSPPVVRVDDGGRLIVRKGQRRTLAACRAGLPKVRVLIEPEPYSGEYDTGGRSRG